MWFIHQFFVLICAVHAVQSIPPTDLRYCHNALRHYGSLRLSLGRSNRNDEKGIKKTTSGDTCSLWYYTGVVRNPTTGKEVVGVEGLEQTKVIPASAMLQEASSALSSASDSMSLLQNSISYLSSKVFVYTDLYNRSVPIREYRLQKISPKRNVEPVIEMNQLNTLGFRRRRDISDPVVAGNTNKKKKESSSPKFDFFSVIQWPSGRTIHTNNIHFNKFLAKDALSPSSVPPSTMNSNSMNGRNSLFDQKDSIRVFHFVHGASAHKSINNSVRSYEPISLEQENGISNIKESRSRFRLTDWVSVSPSGYQPWHGRSQEQYIIAPQTRARSGRFWPLNLINSRKKAASVRNAAAYLNSDVVMQCTRYGECPSWYAVGKMCTTELTAYKLKDSRELPTHIPSLLASCDMSSFLDRLPKPARGTANELNVDAFKQAKDLLQQPQFISWWKKLVPTRLKRGSASQETN